MKIQLLKRYLGYLCIAGLGVVSGCTLLGSDQEETASVQSLSVRFENEPTSEYTINSIELRPMGPLQNPNDTLVSSAPWSANILAPNQRIAPGAHVFFNLDIPNLHFSQCRIGVIDEQGASIILNQQPNYPADARVATITHWGSDERFVSVRLVKDRNSGLIEIAGQSDSASPL